jgi:hypothetical protein
LVVQLGRGVQWPTAFASAVQVAEQQSAPLVQISPSTRHAWRSPQRGWPSLPFAQTLPQQSPFFAHDSPAGLHDALVATQWPAVQRWAQQSAALAHAPPANVQSGEAPHVRSVPAGTHASEQHAPAKAHERPFPRQPFVGRHVSFDVGSSAQSPEQHAVELVHGWPVAVRAHSPPSGALGAASPSEAASCTSKASSVASSAWVASTAPASGTGAGDAGSGSSTFTVATSHAPANARTEQTGAHRRSTRAQ